jgi:UDP-N-acetylglucosamine diphosphorylase/glucosamine-1-phosphate N-acetyltransferase
MTKDSKKKFAIAILAAGKGKRMKNPEMSKVMALLANKPLIAHVLEQALELSPDKIVIIVGHKKESVIDFVNKNYNLIEFAEQNEQLGTGHAVAQTESNFAGYEGEILILSGDVPLLQADTLTEFAGFHSKGGFDLSVLTTFTENPFGYGRIIRDDDNNFVKIVEEKDASEDEKQIKEINSGVYLVKSKLLFDALKKVKNNNTQNEYYLTDIIEMLQKQGYKTGAFPGAEINELQGINSPEDLMLAEKYFSEMNKNA